MVTALSEGHVGADWITDTAVNFITIPPISVYGNIFLYFWCHRNGNLCLSLNIVIKLDSLYS